MRLDISELLRIPGSAQDVELDEPCPSDFDCASRVTGTLSFTSTSNLLIIRGNLRADVRVECTRCLTTFVFPARAEVSEEFAIRDYQVVAEGGQPADEEMDEDLKDLFDGPMFKLDELIRQYLHLSIPATGRLCSETCKGLCPQCGADLNREQCDCVPPEAESPLAGLAAFYPKGNGQDQS